MRQWMINMRIKKGLNCMMAAKKAHCSTKLLDLLEYEDNITHPICAARIAAVYGMDVGQYNDIVHKKHKADVLPTPPPLPTSSDWRAFLKKITHQEKKTGQ